MFFFRKKEKEVLTNEKKAAKSMPRTKKVQFMPRKIDEVSNMLGSDIFQLTTFEPVNYYADKSSYFQCTFFYREDYSEVYFVVEQYDNDFLTSHTQFTVRDYGDSPLGFVESFGMDEDQWRKAGKVTGLRACALTPMMYDRERFGVYAGKIREAMRGKLEKVVRARQSGRL